MVESEGTVSTRAACRGHGGASATSLRGPWLLSERADFWVASAGSGVLLIVIVLVLLWRGDRELSAADVLLGELHLGATYDAIVRRRLWRRMPLDVLAIPVAIVVATYILLLNDGALLVTTAILYVGAWHRGRQSLGIARHYQQRAGGPVSSLHGRLLSASFYLPMMAAVAYYTSTAATHEGEAVHVLSLGPEVLWGLASGAAASVVAYLLCTIGRTAVPGSGPQNSIGHGGAVVHPCERWLVLANALGFGSAYVRRLARFSLWPAIGLTSWAMCTGLRPRRARALVERRPSRPLLAGRSHLDCASPAAGTLDLAPP
jgi:hypothetical protein